MLTGLNAMLLWQMARDLILTLSYRHDKTWHVHVSQLVSLAGQVDNPSSRCAPTKYTDVMDMYVVQACTRT